MYLILWFIAGAALAFGQAVPEPSRARVRVLVYDTFGEAVPGAGLSLTNTVSGQRFTGVGGPDGSAILTEVPYGAYDLEVRLTGFVTRMERLRISQPAVVFRIGLRLGSLQSQSPTKLGGSVRLPLGQISDGWVRLIALYGSDLIEDAVDESGKFTLIGMSPGKYLLILLQTDKVLAIKPIDIYRGEQRTEIDVRP